MGQLPYPPACGKANEDLQGLANLVDEEDLPTVGRPGRRDGADLVLVGRQLPDAPAIGAHFEQAVAAAQFPGESDVAAVGREARVGAGRNTRWSEPSSFIITISTRPAISRPKAILLSGPRWGGNCALTAILRSTAAACPRRPT